jgi:hypothetical protein
VGVKIYKDGHLESKSFESERSLVDETVGLKNTTSRVSKAKTERAVLKTLSQSPRSGALSTSSQKAIVVGP